MRVAAFALLLLTACAAATNAPALDGTSWTLVELSGQPVVANSNVTMQFADSAASGSTGCNSYRGAVTLSGSGLTFGPAMSTKRACIEAPLNAQESAFLNALGNVASYESSAERLTLRNANGDALLVFTRTP